jgi:hypothetical protein
MWSSAYMVNVPCSMVSKNFENICEE